MGEILPLRGKSYDRAYELDKHRELTPGTDPNDDANVEHYRGTSRTLGGRQRKGIRDDRPNAKSMGEHIEESHDAPFFLNQSTPVPKSRERALEFIENADTIAIRDFWKRKNQRVRVLTETLEPDHTIWGDQIPDELMGSAGKLNATAFLQLTNQFNIGGQTGPNDSSAASRSRGR